MCTFFQIKVHEILNDAIIYAGVHGAFVHDNGNGGKYVKIGYHEGLVDPNQWLKVQDKKSHNVCFSSNRCAFNS